MKELNKKLNLESDVYINQLIQSVFAVMQDEEYFNKYSIRTAVYLMIGDGMTDESLVDIREKYKDSHDGTTMGFAINKLEPFIKETYAKEFQDGVIDGITDSVMDMLSRKSEEDRSISGLISKIIENIGSLDPNLVRTIIESIDKVKEKEEVEEAIAEADTQMKDLIEKYKTTAE